MKNLLVIYHSQSGTTEKMANAVLSGAYSCDKKNVSIRVVDPIKATSSDVLWADALILGTPTNFGYMSGALKYFFDHIYYDCIDQKRGLSYALFIKGDTDTTGALVAIDKITSGLGWREISEPLIMTGELSSDYISECRELGLAVATGLEAGIF